MSYVSRPNTTTCPTAAQNMRLCKSKNCQMSNLRRIKQLPFITSRTEIPTQHVLHTTKDLDEKGFEGRWIQGSSQYYLGGDP